MALKSRAAALLLGCISGAAAGPPAGGPEGQYHFSQEWSVPLLGGLLRDASEDRQLETVETPPTTTAMPNRVTTTAVYDCVDGFTAWESLWTYEKKVWCCDVMDLGCPTDGQPYPSTTEPTFNCLFEEVNWESSWSKEKQRWCCRTLRVGCVEDDAGADKTRTLETLFDCTELQHSDALEWSEDKKDFCCQTERKACPDGSSVWSVLDTALVEEYEHPSTTTTTTTSTPAGPPLPYDCAAGTRWWGQAQKAWCCEHFARGCSADHEEAEPRCFDCEEDLDLEPWELAWSDTKKAWCCSNCLRRCPKAMEALPGYHRLARHGREPADDEAASFYESLATSTTTQTATVAPFDCSPGSEYSSSRLDGEEASWSPEFLEAKKAWCCLHANVGCEPLDFDTLVKRFAAIRLQGLQGLQAGGSAFLLSGAAVFLLGFAVLRGYHATQRRRQPESDALLEQVVGSDGELRELDETTPTYTVVSSAE